MMLPPRMRFVPFSFVLLGCLVGNADANTEKVIFAAPSTINIPQQPPTLADLQLPTLTHADRSIRTHLKVRFPTNSSDRGIATWLLLDELVDSQRYEVRVCWAATPSTFALDVFELSNVWAAPELITSLAEYSYSELKAREATTLPDPIHSSERVASVMLLRILAAADYFTDDADMMTNPRPVYVDIILDPYVFNLVPESLLRTIGCVVLVAVLSWFLAGWLARWLERLSQPQIHESKKKI